MSHTTLYQLHQVVGNVCVFVFVFVIMIAQSEQGNRWQIKSKAITTTSITATAIVIKQAIKSKRQER